MARIRSIKPELWHDPEFVRCTPLARLLWIGSWNLADDQGVLKDEPERLRLAVLPGDMVDAEALVDELVKARLLLRKRTTDGEAVLVIRTFREHQKIDARRDGKWGNPDDLLDLGTLDEELALNGAYSRQRAPTRASPRQCAPERDHTIKEGIKDQGSLSGAAAPKDGKKRGSRVPDPFNVTDDMAAWAEEHHPAVDWEAESNKFLDYWRSKPGNGGVKLDWPATWRNWIRNAAERSSR